MKRKSALVDPDHQAGWFAKLRRAHQMETAEDYVELIADLISANGEARVSDLARRFGVSHTTVNKVISRLNRENLVVNQPYRSLFLTEAGEALAIKSKKRHQIVVTFLMALGISSEVAEADAEGIEHHVSKETLKAFQDFLENNRG